MSSTSENSPPASNAPESKRARSGRPRLSTVPDGEAVPVAKGSHVVLVDGSGYIFRAFHALPPLTRPSDGLPVGAVHGFCQMIWKLLAEAKGTEKPTHIAVIFDAGVETFRNQIYDKYKMHRPPPPEELVPQFALIRDAVKAFNLACIELDGYEADDIIATYAKLAVAAGGEVTIVSSDKDLMQLIRSGITMLDTMKGRRLGPAEVVEKFGVPPEKVVDVQALAGDSIDNVPGVPGIGVKTAAELITTYGDLDQLLARAVEIKQPKRREKLIEFAEQARISRELVRLKDDVPLPAELAALAVRQPQAADLLGFLRLMEFSTLTRRIADALGAEAPPPLALSVGSTVRPAPEPAEPRSNGSLEVRAPVGGSVPGPSTPAAAVAHWAKVATAASFDRTKYETVTTLERLEGVINEALDIGRIAIDTRTSSGDPMRAELVGLAIALSPGRAWYVPLAHVSGSRDLFAGQDLVPGQLPSPVVLDRLRPLLEDEATLKVGHDLKFDGLVLARRGITIAPVDDTMLLSYALDAGRGSHALDSLAERHLGHTCMRYETVIETAPGSRKADRTFAGVPIATATEYAAEQVDAALRLWMRLKPRLVAERMTTVYETLERPLLPVLVDMEKAGIKVDRAILSRITGTLGQGIARLEDEVQALAAPAMGGAKLNLGSPRQLGELLFDRLKLPGGKRTKSGQWETRAGLLDDMAGNEELPEGARTLINTMLEWRQLAKLKSTYTDALPTYVHPDTGRIHTTYALAATTTGRLSSNEPNLQNIPVRTKEGRQIRSAFIAEAGHVLVSADYSQIELRVLAHIADIPQLKTAFADGLDIHAMTASEMFGVPIKDMPAEVRRRAKAINFGIIYGISAFGLANQLGLPKQEAGEYIATYFKRFPGIRDYMERTKAFAHANGYVETVFGRRIHYPDINTRNPSMRAFLERASINAPIQGSAADVIRRAMVRMPPALAKAGLRHIRMLLQVHDELVFEASREEAAAAMPVIARVMESAAEPAVKFAVPLKVDARSATSWDEAH